MNIEPVTYSPRPPDWPGEGPVLLHEVLHQRSPGQPGPSAGTMETMATVETATVARVRTAHTRLLVLVRGRPVIEVVWKNI